MYPVPEWNAPPPLLGVAGMLGLGAKPRAARVCFGQSETKESMLRNTRNTGHGHGGRGTDKKSGVGRHERVTGAVWVSHRLNDLPMDAHS